MAVSFKEIEVDIRAPLMGRWDCDIHTTLCTCFNSFVVQLFSSLESNRKEGYDLAVW